MTVGQAYGGEHEAVTLHSGLLAAKHVLDADVAVVIQGPGNVGTGTAWGYTGVAAGEALNAVGTLGGRGVAALRVSDADPSAAAPRHLAPQHHGIRPDLPGRGGPAAAPHDAATSSATLVAEQAHALAARAQGALRVREVDPRTGSTPPCVPCPVRLSTMGRGLDEDHAAFLYSAAAGRYAARLLSEGCSR